MIKRILYSLLLGLGFCIGQSLGESIFGLFITTARRTSEVDFEGAIMYMWIRIAMTLIPYLTTFVIMNMVTKEKIRPSFVSLGLNVIILLYFIKIGLLQKDPISFIIGSLLTSLFLILVEEQTMIRKLKKTQ